MTLPLLFELMNRESRRAESSSGRGGGAWPASQSTCAGTYQNTCAGTQLDTPGSWDPEELARARASAAEMMWHFAEAEHVMARRNAASRDTSMTKRAFADTFGVSEAQLERLFQKGMPHEKTSSRRSRSRCRAGRVWYHEYLVKKGEKKAAPATINEARLRKETAQASLEELKLAREQGVTMRVEEHEKLLGEAFSRVRAKLLNLAPRAAGAAFGATSMPGVPGEDRSRRHRDHGGALRRRTTCPLPATRRRKDARARSA
jgi:phage terminase Nu1 subunit (DNA packaging protein)